MRKDIFEKMEILSNSAKYDVSCSSSGEKETHKIGELGASHSSGICHTYTADGRCVSLLKVLLTNYCIYDCAYCINKISNDAGMTSTYDLDILKNTKKINEYDIAINEINIKLQYSKLYFKTKGEH